MATDKIQINLRVGEDLREKIQAAATGRGVSVNREITERVQKTFDEDVKMSLDGGGATDLYAIIRTMASAMELSGPMAAFMATHSDDATAGWLNNAFAYDQAVKAAITVLEAFRPKAQITANPATLEIGKALGQGFANSMLEEAASGQTRTPGNPTAVARAKRLHGDLGDLADRIQAFNNLNAVKKQGKRR